MTFSYFFQNCCVVFCMATVTLIHIPGNSKAFQGLPCYQPCHYSRCSSDLPRAFKWTAELAKFKPKTLKALIQHVAGPFLPCPSLLDGALQCRHNGSTLSKASCPRNPAKVRKMIMQNCSPTLTTPKKTASSDLRVENPKPHQGKAAWRLLWAASYA